MTPPTTCTFNSYVGGVTATQITLQEHHPQEFTEGGATEEGYSYTYTTFELREGVVYRETHVDSRDCDGQLERWQMASCPIPYLHARQYEGTVLPEWTEVDNSQRDHSAERMGY